MNRYLLFVFSLWTILLISCVTGKSIPDSIRVEQSEDGILERPRFDKPVLRPLNSVRIKWMPVSGAIGYELQESESSDFTVISRNWTISGSSIELNYEVNTVCWYRIRSFDQQRTSRWSAIHRLDPRNL